MNVKSRPLGSFYRLAGVTGGLLGLALLVAAGCSDVTRTPRQTAVSATAAAAERKSELPKQSSAAERETWDIFAMRGTRVGYGQTRITSATQAAQKVVRCEGLQHLDVQRFGERSQQEVRFTSLETPEGRLIEFNTEIQQGSAPQRTTGRVEGNQLQIETATQGKKINASIPWSADYGGFLAQEQSLLRKPMQPGEQRTLRALVAAVNQVATIEMSAQKYEPTQLRNGTFDLLRIDSVMRFPDGQSLAMTAWCDRTGDVLKTRMDALDMESFRATKAEALEKIEAPGFDLGRDLSVRLDKPAPERFERNPHATKQVRYRVKLEGGDPASVFISGPTQRIKSLDSHTAEVTVYAIRPNQPGGNPDAKDDPPAADDRGPNNFIQSDNPKIVAMAREAAGDQQDPWQAALKLEQYVHRLIKQKDFSQVFATAAEVAENPVGDCTEHAVLLAALCRARGIPARTAIGLVHVPGTQSFGYHMWAEAFIGKRWIPIDAIVAEGGIGAAHLKLAHTNLKGASAYSSFLPVIQVAGRLKIEIEDVQ